MDFGRWESLRYDEINAFDAEGYSNWLEDPSVYTPPEGESLSAFFMRVTTAFEAITEDHTQGDAAVISHGGTVRAILCHSLGLTKGRLWSFLVDPASVSVLKQIKPNGFVLELLNDTSYILER